MSLKEELITYLDASYPIIYIISNDEMKTDRVIRAAVGKRKVFEWNRSVGYCDFDTKSEALEEYSSLTDALTDLLTFEDSELNKNLLVLKDADDYLSDPDSIALLKRICHKIRDGLDTGIIIVSQTIIIPRALEKYITILKEDNLNLDEISKVVESFSEEQNISINDSLKDKMKVAFRGLSAYDIENLLAAAMAKDGEITDASLLLIHEQKRQLILKSNLLDMITVDEKAEIGGLENLKEWLSKKAEVFKNYDDAQKSGVDMPKGVLIAGVPGCGKSLTAKVTSKMFEVPLLKLDMGKILGKYVGESENNMRRAIELAESISPCVLWIDEMEKLFSTDTGHSNEVTMRLMGTFLTWMQEKKSPVFIVATANEIGKLPIEMTRKGRFDDIFFVGLPDKNERRDILKIHISRRNTAYWNQIQDKESALDEILCNSKGFSGADLEGAVIDAIENAFLLSHKGKAVDFAKLLNDSIQKTKSISILMGKVDDIKDDDSRKKKNAIDVYIAYFEKHDFKNASNSMKD